MKRSKGVNSFKKRKKHGRKYSKRHKRTKYSKSKKYSKKSNKRSKYSKRRRRQRGGAIVEGLYEAIKYFTLNSGKEITQDEHYNVTASSRAGHVHYKNEHTNEQFEISEEEHEKLVTDEKILFHLYYLASLTYHHLDQSQILSQLNVLKLF